MGHIRLGFLPATQKWQEVVALIGSNAAVAEIADATADAAETEFRSATEDPALTYAVWLLIQLPLAARSPQFENRLAELGFEAGAEQSLLSLVSNFSLAIDRHVATRDGRTDLGELARLAGAESLTAVIGPGLPSLFAPDALDVRLELGKLTSKIGFARLARDFFSRLTQKTLEYYLSRELPNHIGPDRAISSVDKQIAFRNALERHCREASKIVEEFAGGWYSKANYKGAITPRNAQAFTAYALNKMRDELRMRRSADG